MYDVCMSCKCGAVCCNKHTRASQTEASDDEQVHSLRQFGESLRASPLAVVITVTH